MTDVDAELRPWFDRLGADVAGLELYDAHTHVGRNDPDGMKQEPEELLAGLAAVDARGIVFPMHEPDGYPPANDAVLAAAEASDKLVAFCRVNPHDGAVAEAERCLDAGARGIKLHPRAERFTLLRARGARSRGARARAQGADAGPCRPRDPGARARHGGPQRRVPGRHADPRPLRRVRPRLAVARAARAPEPA